MFGTFRNLITPLLLTLIAHYAQAQVGIGTTTPEGSAQLEVRSPNKGVLIPRMDSQARDQIQAPATGLLIYQTDPTPGFYYFDGVAWQPLKTPAQAPAGAIIPYASGLPIVMTTVFGGLLNTSAVIGFGSSASGISKFGGAINLSGAPGLSMNFAFSVPRNGKITSISGLFSTAAAVSLIGSSMTISAQLYSSTAGNNTFTAVPGAIVTLSPSLTGVLAMGSVVSGITSNLNISVSAEDRLLLVYSAAITGGNDVVTSVVGYASAGVSIE